MPLGKVIEMFERPMSVNAAMHAPRETRLATGATMRVEPEYLVEELHPLQWPARDTWGKRRCSATAAGNPSISSTSGTAVFALS